MFQEDYPDLLARYGDVTEAAADEAYRHLKRSIAEKGLTLDG